MLLGKDGLNFLGVFVHRLAYHLDTEVVRALAVVSAIQVVMALKPVKVYLDQELGEVRDLPFAVQKFRDALRIEKSLEAQRFHLAPAGTEHDV
ncbi:oxygen-independent coproporphyrinogen III oxidase [Alicycliphilus sp. B1]|nr:oxygen-independent coproporphyrinogen III oxidase [Alicycliphilus sp. B1]